MCGSNPGLTTGLEEPLDAFVAKGLYHCVSVAYSATRHKDVVCGSQELRVGGEIVIKQRSGALTGPGSAADKHSDPVQQERDREGRRVALA